MNEGIPANRLREIGVVFCVDNMFVGGTELNALRLARLAHARDWRISVACLNPQGPLAEHYAAAGIEVQAYPINGLVGIRALSEGMRFRKELIQRRVAIVHAHDRYTNIFAIPIARSAGIKAIASKRWNTSRRVHRVANRFAFRLADRVVANSEAVAHSLAFEDHVPESRIAVIRNFVNNDAFSSPPRSWLEGMRQRLDLQAEDCVIGVVANLRPIKDHATLLRALPALRQRLPNLKVVLVGDGESRGALIELAEALSVSDLVRFAGFLPHLPNPHFLFDLSVLCSRGEGSPNSILEAMAAGRAVVATHVGGIPDIVDHERTGLLVPSEEPEQLGEAIASLLIDHDRRESMGATAKQIAFSRFSSDIALAHLATLYADVLGLKQE